MAGSWTYKSRNYCHVLAYDRATMIKEYVCKTPHLWPGLLRLTGTAPVINSPVRATDTESTLLAFVYTDDRSRRFTMPVANSPSAPVYNARGRFMRPHRFRTPVPTLLVRTGLQRRGQLICAASDVAAILVVRLSRPGLHRHTGPHLSA